MYYEQHLQFVYKRIEAHEGLSLETGKSDQFIGRNQMTVAGHGQNMRIKLKNYGQ